MKIVDSNFNQHLLLFQHIPLVKGNDDFPVSDYSDTDMNLGKQASSFQPLQDVLGFGAFCGFCFVFESMYHEQTLSHLYGVPTAIGLHYMIHINSLIYSI